MATGAPRGLRWMISLPLAGLGALSLGWTLFYAVITGLDPGLARSLAVHAAFGAGALAGSAGLLRGRPWAPWCAAAAASLKLAYVLARADEMTGPGADHLGLGLLIASWSLLEALILAALLAGLGLMAALERRRGA